LLLEFGTSLIVRPTGPTSNPIGSYLHPCANVLPTHAFFLNFVHISTFLFVGGNSSLDPYGVAAHVSRRGREGHVLLALNAYERSKDSPWGSVAVCVRRSSAVVSVAEQSEAS
jgi:hypothetical protein